MKKKAEGVKLHNSGRNLPAALKKIGLKIRNYVLDTEEVLPGQKIRWKRVFGLSALVAFLFALPAIVTNIIFDWIPMFDGIIKAFCYVDSRGNSYFVGLQNFKNVFSDPILYKSIGNMLFFFVFNLLLMFPTIICTVVMFRMKSAKVQYVYRVLLCLPMVVPSLVFTLLWIFVFGYNFGVLTDLAERLFGHRYNFLGDPKLIKWTILFTGIPWVTSNNVLIYIGGLNGISESVWDAAKMDGVEEKIAAAKAAAKTAEAAATQEKKEEISYVRVVLVALLLLAWYILMPRIGFIISTIVIMCIMSYLLGCRNKIVLVAFPVLFTLTLYFAFVVLLHVSLPEILF